MVLWYIYMSIFFAQTIIYACMNLYSPTQIHCNLIIHPVAHPTDNFPSLPLIIIVITITTTTTNIVSGCFLSLSLSLSSLFPNWTAIQFQLYITCYIFSVFIFSSYLGVNKNPCPSLNLKVTTNKWTWKGKTKLIPSCWLCKVAVSWVSLFVCMHKRHVAVFCLQKCVIHWLMWTNIFILSSNSKHTI